MVTKTTSALFFLVSLTLVLSTSQLVLGLDPIDDYVLCIDHCKYYDCQQEFSDYCMRFCHEKCDTEDSLNPQQEGREQQNNPFVFDENRFFEIFREEEGSARVLRSFAKLSNLLTGIDDYRFTLLEANPSTFIMPAHFDAEAVFYFIQGRGIINLIQQEGKETYRIERGDVIRVPVGTMVYLINPDNRQKLQVAHLFKAVALPNRYRAFHSVGGELGSFFQSFSDDILQAAFNTQRERLEKLFGGQKKVVITRASQEQIKALSSSVQPREGGERMSIRGPYNLLRNCFLFRLGRQCRVNPSQYSQLKDLDLSVSFTNISSGAMTAPFYNFKEMAVIFVVEGTGRFEMSSPYLPSTGSGQHYQRVSSRISPQTVFVIPPGHPAVILASDNEHLKILTFSINGGDDPRSYLAGKNNILNQLEKEAKELSFNMEAKEVDSIINNQTHMFFLPGPNQSQKQFTS